MKSVVLKLGATALKSMARMKAAGDLALPPLPLQKEPSVVAQMRWASGQCWGASVSTAIKSDGVQFRVKSD